MIKRATAEDYGKLAAIWLECSLQAHDFVPENYWRQMRAGVIRDYFPCTETLIFEDKRQYKGFICIADGRHIGALFVAPKFQGKKVGAKLLRCAQRKYSLLTLNVFVKNPRAVKFYQQNGFKIIAEQIEPSTGEKELQMSWALGCKSGFCKKYYGDS